MKYSNTALCGVRNVPITKEMAVDENRCPTVPFLFLENVRLSLGKTH